MRVLVTGAQHPLAAALIARLSRCDAVIAQAPTPVALEVPVACGGPEVFRSALAGVQAVVHMLPAAFPHDALALGTERLVEAVRWHRVSRLVVLCPARGSHPDVPVAVAREAALQRLLEAGAVVLRPGWPLTSGGLGCLRAWAASELPAGAGGLSLADPRDVLGAAEAALQKGHPGADYGLRAEDLTWSALRERLRGGPGPRAALPPGEPPLGVADERIDDAAARRDLGWWHRNPARSWADALG